MQILYVQSRMSSDHHFEKSVAYNELYGCPSGYHKRAHYKTSTGKTVPTRCVRSTTVYKNSSKNFKRKTLRKQKDRIKLYIPSVHTLARSVCPPGQIERKAYVRKYSTAVRQRGFTVRRAGKIYRAFPKNNKGTIIKPICVKDTGKPGKGVPNPIGPLRKGELSKYGYSFRIGEDKRHQALRQAVDEFGALGVFRKLVAVANLTEKTAPDASRIFNMDRKWIEEKYGPLKAF
jgi:hypothetical protein